MDQCVQQRIKQIGIMSNAAETSTVGSRLREVRQLAGLSQEAFSAQLGIARPTLGAYESGRNEPGISLLVSLHASGHDAVYVALGQRSATFAASVVDWPLVIEMATVVQTWAQRRDRVPTSKEQSAILEAAYKWGVGGDKSAAHRALELMLSAA